MIYDELINGISPDDIFVNEKKVEVKGTYNTRTNIVEYNEPGRVVEELTLGN